MTAREAMTFVDGKMHNVYSEADKLHWLTRVETMAGELAERFGIDPPVLPLTPETELSIPTPWDQIYLRWLEAQINYANQEYLKYNNAMTVFNALWNEYANKTAREHLRERCVYQF